ncbi:MAG: hypothetical protein LQ341_005495 [Variospora aurantia]|nr:MAG: hypothetical protein LQ341_005495 [Variospora aurantia]
MEGRSIFGEFQVRPSCTICTLPLAIAGVESAGLRIRLLCIIPREICRNSYADEATSWSNYGEGIGCPRSSLEEAYSGKPQAPPRRLEIFKIDKDLDPISSPPSSVCL